MDESVYEQLLGEDSLFAPSGNHRTFEVSYDGTGAKPQVREGSLAERQLVGWCQEAASSSGSSTGASLRLLVCSPRVGDRNIWPLPMSSSTLRDILAAWRIPSLFPRAICRHIPIATTFDALDDSGVSGFLLRTNLSWTWQYALAMTHNPRTKTTTGLVLGLRGDEIHDVLRALRRAPSMFYSAAMLPCILMDKAFEALIKDAEERRKSLIQISFETGLHGFHDHKRASFKLDASAAAATADGGPADDRDDLDLDVLMQKLTTLTDACAGISAVCKMQHNFIGTLTAFVAQSDPSGAAASSRHALQQLHFFGQLLQGVESKVVYTKTSCGGQVQTIYTLIEQRDARTHRELTDASRRLAELSRKDSTDMRTIAAVTLVFLPATFTATFFSTSFFDFQPREGDKASAWIWLYVVTTVLLTAVVLALWFYAAHLQYKKEVAAYGRRKSEPPWGSKVDSESAMFDLPPATQDTFRPYLSGSISEGIFAKRVSIPLDTQAQRLERRMQSINVSPTSPPGFPPPNLGP